MGIIKHIMLLEAGTHEGRKLESETKEDKNKHEIKQSETQNAWSKSLDETWESTCLLFHIHVFLHHQNMYSERTGYSWSYVFWLIWLAVNTPVIIWSRKSVSYSHSCLSLYCCFEKKKKCAKHVKQLKNNIFFKNKSWVLSVAYADVESSSWEFCKLTDKYSLAQTPYCVSEDPLNCNILEWSLVWWWAIEQNESSISPFLRLRAVNLGGNTAVIKLMAHNQCSMIY